MRVGFTGTRRGLQQVQLGELERVLLRISVHGGNVLHHGDCVGADEQADQIARRFGWDVVIHPSNIDRYRASCDRRPGGAFVTDVQPALTRNATIVGVCHALVACPKGHTEENRSGTWHTVRLARKRSMPIALVWPSGRTTLEGAWSPLDGRDLSDLAER